MFKPFPMIAVTTQAGATQHISVGHITEITIVSKKTCVHAIDSPMITTPESIEQVVARVQQAGGILLEVQDKSGTMHYIMACNIVRVMDNPKGPVSIYTMPPGSRASASMIVTEMPAETIMQQLAALRQ